MMPNSQKNNVTTAPVPSLERKPSRKLTAAYGYSENTKFSMYTDQKTETETDASASLYRGSESDFNTFCNLDDEWCDDDEDADEQVIPRIISASVVKTKEPVGLVISCNSDARYTSPSVVVSSISPQSPFHPENYSHGEAIREGDEILTINGHRVKDARRAAEMIRATEEGLLTVVASTAAPAGGHGASEGRRTGVRRRIDGTAYHMIRLSTYVTEGGSSASMSRCNYRGMELEVIDQTSSFVSIKSIEPSSVFARSGLKAGDVLLTVDGSIVRTVDAAIRALRDDHGTDGIDRVVILLVFSVWDMRTRVIRDELSGTSPNDWDISLSCEEELGQGASERECITLTMSDTTVSFELTFDPDGTCSCPEPLAALNSFPQHEKLDPSEDSSLRFESESIASKTEARAALELLFQRHIQRVVDALNYHCWRQARLITCAVDAFGGNRIDQIRVHSALRPAGESFQKSFPVALSLSATTTSTKSLTSSCPSINFPKSKSLLILNDLEKAMATQPQAPTFSLYNFKESLSHEKLVASQQVLHSMTNLTRALIPHSLTQLEPTKVQSNSLLGVEKPLRETRAQENRTASKDQNKPPDEIVMQAKRPKYIPPLNTDESSNSSSSSEDNSDDSSSDNSPPRRRRSQRKAPIKKSKIAPVANQIVLINSQQPRATPRNSNEFLQHSQRLEQKNAASSAPSLDIQQGRIQSIYKVSSKVVGLGAFGAVRYCTHRATRKEFAVKSIPKNTDNKYAALLENEISILQQVHHKNVIRLVDLMQDDKYIHIVMEKCQGGDLFDKVIKDGVVFREKMVSQIIANILDAVDYLHERNICHRDLKVRMKL
ncbi:hypothetical protein HJC23_013121 [Cyclotella cryptica]|uniref:Uncharacterized protein n=1 Tax=Cyclotella cryptica TaxID=29204 RepID=A0ABD3QNV8_9STRA